MPCAASARTSRSLNATASATLPAAAASSAPPAVPAAALWPAVRSAAGALSSLCAPRAKATLAPQKVQTPPSSAQTRPVRQAKRNQRPSAQPSKQGQLGRTQEAQDVLGGFAGPIYLATAQAVGDRALGALGPLLGGRAAFLGLVRDDKAARLALALGSAHSKSAKVEQLSVSYACT